MTSQPVERSGGAGETVAGFLATVSIFASFFAVAYRPVRIIPFAIVLAFVAAGMAAGRSRRLAAFAVGISALCFIAGMIVAILTRHPLY